MAIHISSSTFRTQLLFIVVLALSCWTECSYGCFSSIISFGDSIADTGNSLGIARENNKKLPHYCFPPYGETFFHRPTGRCSDGRLIIDFLAEKLGLPLVPPYISGLNTESINFRQGVNFAVAGATALDATYLENRGLHNLPTNVSLGTQLHWFKELLPTLCSTTSECKDVLQTSLVLVGEIGGNDYNYGFIAGTSLEEIQTFVAPVVNIISSTIIELIELGAVTFIVPGNFPIGCWAVYLTQFQTSKKEEYDSLGCIIWLNKFSQYHNEHLQQELGRIKELYPHANIIYADFYNAALSLFKSPKEFGFSKEGIFRACCGGGGPYNYNTSALCANSLSTVCDEPDLYVHWDGVHLTESAYRWISKGLFEGPYTVPRMSSVCPLLDFETASYSL